jgi:hypothetical protein
MDDPELRGTSDDSSSDGSPEAGREARSVHPLARTRLLVVARMLTRTGDTMTTPDRDKMSTLGTAQSQRIECLRSARDILAGTAAPYAFVVIVARWLNTGEWPE